jgi:uncharacterized protein (TIGR00730 family)|tara:strand:+ start:151 stop:717 length:567 start_codon:yes stop_codon:yes gene_type:complete
MPNICVYCGSSKGNDPAFVAAATSLGSTIANHGYGLVYGGASIGLMGTVADSVLASGGIVTGVLPKSLADKELAHQGLSELIVTVSMHDRKARMATLSDAFIALPGGLGTFEELFEIWTWAQLGFHQKPIAVLNVNGYFDKLIAFLEDSAAKGFIKAVHQKMLLVSNSPDELIQKIKSFTPPLVDKLI